jgi:hypothetical protein
LPFAAIARNFKEITRKDEAKYYQDECAFTPFKRKSAARIEASYHLARRAFLRFAQDDIHINFVMQNLNSDLYLNYKSKIFVFIPQ